MIGVQKQYKIKVDITKKYAMPAFEVNTNDLKSIRLSIEVLNGASPLDLKDKTVRIAIRKPDNHIVFQDCTITDAANGQVEVILENQAYITPGTHTAEIMCYKGNDVVAVSGTFSYKSSKGIMNDEAVESKSEFTAINRTIEEAERILEDLRENGGGVGVDEQARQGIQDVTAQLADTTSNLGRVKNLKPRETQIIGHRGASKYAPENTLPSIEKAAELKYFGVECDIRATSDKKIVIMHDPEVDRTTNGTGKVNDLTLAQIKSFNIDTGPNIDKYPGLKVPTFDEWVAHCKKFKQMIVVHGNMPGYEDELIKTLKKYDMESSAVFISEHMPFINALKAKSSLVSLSYITFDTVTDSTLNHAKSNGLGLSFDYSKATEEAIRKAHMLGLEMNAWTINDKANYDSYKSYDVQFVTTDGLVIEEVQEQETIEKHQYERQLMTSSKAEYLSVMSAALKTEQTSIPTTNGYYFDETANTIHVFSASDKQGFAFIKDLGRVRAGDIVEVFCDVEVKTGQFRIGRDIDGTSATESQYYTGNQKIYRKFIVPSDSEKFNLFMGVGVGVEGSYAITNGINVRVYSNRNYTQPPVSVLRTKLVTDSGTLPERFTRNKGDECSVRLTNATSIQVTFAKSLGVPSGIAQVTGDLNSELYRPITAYANASQVVINFVNTSGVKVPISSLPADMYLNVVML